jgi:hypothetical protein
VLHPFCNVLASCQSIFIKQKEQNHEIDPSPARYALERNQWAEAAALTLHPSITDWEKFPQSELVVVFARGLGAAHSGDVAAANQALERLHTLLCGASKHVACNVAKLAMN